MEKLYMGVAREIITPEVGGQLYGYRPTVMSTSIEDDLTATAFYLKSGDTEAVMITCTVCLINTDLSDEIRTLVSGETGVPFESCMLCATHTHSGPNVAGEAGWGPIDRKYCDEIFIPRIIKAAKDAKADAEAVKVGIASGDSLVGVNRRELNADNRVILGQQPWGCFNPKMTVIAFRKASDGAPKANMIHYGCHCTAAGMNTEVTRDWAGVMTDSLEMQSGAITAFFNGPEGDVGPRLTNGKTTGVSNIRFVYELGHIAARDAVGIYNKIISYDNVPLNVSARPLDLPLKKRLSIDEAKALYELHKDQTVNIRGMTRRNAEKILESYENGYVDKETRAIPQTAIAIGSAAFVSFPYEMFSEVGLRIDKYNREFNVLALSNTNGSEGYFVTEDQLPKGGYEVDMFRNGYIQQYVDNADYYVILESLKNLNAISGQRNG